MPHHTRTTEPGFTHNIPDPSGRGFNTVLSFTDLYGTHVRVKPSSLATESAVWIFTDPQEQTQTTHAGSSVHMGYDHAMELITALAHWAADNQIDSQGLHDHEEVRRRADHITEHAQWIKNNTLWGDDLGTPDDDRPHQEEPHPLG